MATATEKLAPSRLAPQTQLLKDDLDLASLPLIAGGRTLVDLAEVITSAPVSRTIDGASTLTFTVADPDWSFSRAGWSTAKADIEIDGLFFRLKGYDRADDDTVSLVFEDREVAIIRDYPKPGAAHHGYRVWDAHKVSRVDVARQLVAEVTELRIPFFTVEDGTPILSAADTPDPVKRAHQRKPGFAPAAQITVKNKPATPAQKDAIDRVLQTGYSLKARRKVLVVAVMVITQETRAGADEPRNPKAVGLFQQNPDDGWPATGVPEADAAAFFEAAISDDVKNPGLAYTDLAQDVQLSANGSLYAQWRTEAEHTVTAWGISGGDDNPTDTTKLVSTDKTWQFIRGTQTVDGTGKKIFTREDNWSMLQRLASEVTFRCFCVSGAIYFASDLDLLRSQPQMSISPDSSGVDSLAGSFDEGRTSVRRGHRVQRLNQLLTVKCRIGRWQAPPGTVIDVTETELFDGRWLVTQIDRSLFTPDGTITAKRPQTPLPEAQAPEFAQTGGTTTYAPSTAGAIANGGQYIAPGSLVQPVPAAFSKGHGGEHSTLGLPGYPAIDYFANPGSPVIAPENGKIVRFSGQDPKLGPVGAAGGPLGWTIYLQGDSGTEYFITHLQKRLCKVGDEVTVGQQIATVANYDIWGRSSHTHVGVHGGTVTWEMLAAAPLAQTPTKPTARERFNKR